MENKHSQEQQNNDQVSKFKSFTDRFKKKTPEEQANDMLSDISAHDSQSANEHLSQDTKTHQKDIRRENRYKPKSHTAEKNYNEHTPKTHYDNQKPFEKRRWQGKNPQTTHQNKVHSDESKNGIREVKDINEKDNLGLHKDLKRGVEANTRIQRQSLNPHNKLNLNTKARDRKSVV